MPRGGEPHPLKYELNLEYQTTHFTKQNREQILKIKALLDLNLARFHLLIFSRLCRQILFLALPPITKPVHSTASAGISSSQTGRSSSLSNRPEFHAEAHCW